MRKEGTIFEGKTLDDAVSKGLRELGLTRAEVMITMVEEGSSGFLGLGARPYRVRVAPRPGGPIREPEDRFGSDRRGQRGRGRTDRGGRERSRDGGRRAEPMRPDRGPALSEGRNPRRGTGRVARGPEASTTREDHARRDRGRRGGRSGRGTSAPREARPAPRVSGPRYASEEAGSSSAAARSERPQRPTSTLEEGPSLAPEELASQAKRWTEDLLRAMGFEATVTTAVQEDQVSVTVTVPAHEELLTGPKGEVRQALQHLLNLMLNRGGSTRYHLQLEINDFWQRRERELRDLALSLAEESLATGSERTTEYLNAQERRVVHVTLKTDARVKTYALGTGLIKRVAVAPADYPGGPQDEG